MINVKLYHIDNTLKMRILFIKLRVTSNHGSLDCQRCQHLAQYLSYSKWNEDFDSFLMDIMAMDLYGLYSVLAIYLAPILGSTKNS